MAQRKEFGPQIPASPRPLAELASPVVAAADAAAAKSSSFRAFDPGLVGAARPSAEADLAWAAGWRSASPVAAAVAAAAGTGFRSREHLFEQ